MKVIIDIKETAHGHVGIEIKSVGGAEGTRKEQCYSVNILDLLKKEIPAMGAALGAKGTFGGEGNPRNS